MQISCLDIYIRGWHFKLWNKVVNWINQTSSTLLFAGKSISDRHEEQHLRRRQLRKIRWVKNPSDTEWMKIPTAKIQNFLTDFFRWAFEFASSEVHNASENKWKKFRFRELCSRLVNHCSKHGIFFLVHLVVHFACWMRSFCGTGPGVYKPNFFKDFF